MRSIIRNAFIDTYMVLILELEIQWCMQAFMFIPPQLAGFRSGPNIQFTHSLFIYLINKYVLISPYTYLSQISNPE